MNYRYRMKNQKSVRLQISDWIMYMKNGPSEIYKR